MKILPTETLRLIDRYTIEQEGVDSLELIARVAKAVAQEVISRFPPSTPVTVFAGRGNNGADALLAALRLYEAGFNPSVYLFNIRDRGNLSRDCAACRQQLLASGFTGLIEVIDNFYLPELPDGSVVIDGLFGSGLKAPITGGYTVVAEAISDSNTWVLSIDVPSGLFGDWNYNKGVVLSKVVHASLTLGIQFPKLAYFMDDNYPILGDWKLIDIGLSAKAEADGTTKFYAMEAEDVKKMLKPRPVASSKADYGWGLLIAGAYGMMGAAVMAARGALRSGIGKLTVHAPKCGFNIIQQAVPEAMFTPDIGGIVNQDMTITNHHYTAVGVGPGLGTNDATRGALETLIKTERRAFVLDADALNIISLSPGLADFIPHGSILTPHPGEFDRLFGHHSGSEARVIRAMEMARKMRVVIVLKGHNTAIALPNGQVVFNTSGTPAMATPGSGDVLTGILTSLMAQGYRSEEAAMIGVYVHGLAGEIAQNIHGDYGVTAGDIANNVGKAIKMIMLNA